MLELSRRFQARTFLWLSITTNKSASLYRFQPQRRISHKTTSAPGRSKLTLKLSIRWQSRGISILSWSNSRLISRDWKSSSSSETTSLQQQVLTKSGKNMCLSIPKLYRYLPATNFRQSNHERSRLRSNRALAKKTPATCSSSPFCL